MKDYSFWSDDKLIDRFTKMRAACENPQWKEMSIAWMRLLHKKACLDYCEMRMKLISSKLACSVEFMTAYMYLSAFVKCIYMYIEEAEGFHE